MYFKLIYTLAQSDFVTLFLLSYVIQGYFNVESLCWIRGLNLWSDTNNLIVVHVYIWTLCMGMLNYLSLFAKKLVMTTSSFNQKQVGLLNCVLHLSGIFTLVNIFYVGGLKHPYVISRNEM